MLNIQALDRSGRRKVLFGLLAQYNLGHESAKAALATAHESIPGFTALIGRNARIMRPEVAVEKTLRTILAAPAKPVVPKADPRLATTVRFTLSSLAG